MSNSERKYTYFITGGGTGGHIYPAVAVADALYTDAETEAIYYIGNPDNLEAEIVGYIGVYDGKKPMVRAPILTL